MVDIERTISSDLHEVYNIFGVEAARNLIIDEITEIFSSSSSYINYRHIALLADLITNKGILMSIDRHGLNKSDIGPLAKCSFEETPDIIIKAAIFNELDNIKGVSSNIMLGQEVPVGTGSVDLLFDEQQYIQEIQKLNKDKKEEKVKEEIINNEMCDPELFTDNIFNNFL